MKLFTQLIKLSSFFAFALAMLSANTTCTAWGHQPKMPTAVLKLKKQ